MKDVVDGCLNVLMVAIDGLMMLLHLAHDMYSIANVLLLMVSNVVAIGYSLVNNTVVVVVILFLF